MTRGLGTEVVLSIAAAEARDACLGIPNPTDRVRAAFRAVRNHWMVTDENEQFSAGVAGAIVATEDEGERATIKRAWEARKAVASGDVGRMIDLAEEMPEDGEEINLLTLWNEAAE